MKQKDLRGDERIQYKFPLSVKRITLSFLALGSSGHPQVIDADSSEIMDLSSNGMRIRFRKCTLEEGTILLVKVPTMAASVTVPSLAQVRWIKAGKSRTCEAGLKYVIE